MEKFGPLLPWMKTLMMLSCILYGATNLCAQPISWEAERPLEWSDFRGKARRMGDFKAMTNSGLDFSYEWSGSSAEVRLTLNAFAYFDPQKSWRLKKETDVYMLAHEQLHFDITEWAARKLRKAFQEYPFTDDFEREADQLFKEMSRWQDEIQRQYDRETDHSLRLEAQTRWNKRVAKALSSLEAYAEPAAVIRNIKLR